MDEEPGLLDQWLHADDKGSFGEYLIDYALKSLPGYAQKLCNIYIPYKNKTSEIDVIMLHETGIYVFESKNYSGWIFGDEKNQYWVQCLNPKTKNKFYNPIMQNKTHIKALKEFLSLENQENIFSYIIFSERCELKKISKQSENITVTRRPNMLKNLREHIKNQPNVFTKEQIDNMYEELLPLVDVTDEEKAEHINKIKNKVSSVPPMKRTEEKPHKEGIPICPKCGIPMVLRTAQPANKKSIGK